MFSTLEQFCNHPFRVDKRSGRGTLEYRFVLKKGVLYIEILKNLDSSGQPASGTYTKGPVSLKKILEQSKEGAKRSGNNDDVGFWRAILEHQGIIP